MLRIESPQWFLWGEPRIGADDSAITGTVPPKGKLITYQASSQAIRGTEEEKRYLRHMTLPMLADVTKADTAGEADARRTAERAA